MSILILILLCFVSPQSLTVGRLWHHIYTLCLSTQVFARAIDPDISNHRRVRILRQLFEVVEYTFIAVADMVRAQLWAGRGKGVCDGVVVWVRDLTI